MKNISSECASRQLNVLPLHNERSWFPMIFDTVDIYPTYKHFPISFHIGKSFRISYGRHPALTLSLSLSLIVQEHLLIKFPEIVYGINFRLFHTINSSEMVLCRDKQWPKRMLDVYSLQARKHSHISDGLDFFLCATTESINWVCGNSLWFVRFHKQN